MDEAVLQERIGQLLSVVRRDRGESDFVATGEAPAPKGGGIRREMAAIEGDLDHLRLAIKYLVFDLEATKRENRLLREMLG